MNETKKAQIIRRIKHRAPEIIIGVSIVAGTVATVWIKKDLLIDRLVDQQ